MLDAGNAEAHQFFHQPRPVGVGRNRQVQLVRRVKDGLKLRVVHLDVVRIIVGSGKAAGGHDLDEVRAQLLLPPHGGRKEIGAVAEAGVELFHEIAEHRVGAHGLRHVGVAAGGAQQVRGHDQARAGQMAFVDGALDVQLVGFPEPAHGTDGGYAAVQGPLGRAVGGQRAVAVGIVNGVGVHIAPVEILRMHVGVDDAGRHGQMA